MSDDLHEFSLTRTKRRKKTEKNSLILDSNQGGSVQLNNKSTRMASSEKLHKMLAQIGLGSRREMEALILAGKVEVNGETANIGQRISPLDRVFINHRPIKINFERPLPQVLIYHKPEGEIVSRHDPDARKSVFDALPPVRGGKWIAIGRLDFNTSGLMVFTTDGFLANFMMHPSHEVEREYAVRIIGELTPELSKKLCHQVILDDGPAHFNSIIDKGGSGCNHWYHVNLKEGRNREVRRLFEAVGLAVSRLIRIRYGPITLPPRLRRGHYSFLDEEAVRNLLVWSGFPQPDYAPQQRKGDKVIRAR